MKMRQIVLALMVVTGCAAPASRERPTLASQGPTAPMPPEFLARSQQVRDILKDLERATFGTRSIRLYTQLTEWALWTEQPALARALEHRATARAEHSDRPDLVRDTARALKRLSARVAWSKAALRAVCPLHRAQCLASILDASDAYALAHDARGELALGDTFTQRVERLHTHLSAGRLEHLREELELLSTVATELADPPTSSISALLDVGTQAHHEQVLERLLEHFGPRYLLELGTQDYDARIQLRLCLGALELEDSSLAVGACATALALEARTSEQGPTLYAEALMTARVRAGDIPRATDLLIRYDLYDEGSFALLERAIAQEDAASIARIRDYLEGFLVPSVQEVVIARIELDQGRVDEALARLDAWKAEDARADLEVEQAFKLELEHAILRRGAAGIPLDEAFWRAYFQDARRLHDDDAGIDGHDIQALVVNQALRQGAPKTLVAEFVDATIEARKSHIGGALAKHELLDIFEHCTKQVPDPSALAQALKTFSAHLDADEALKVHMDALSAEGHIELARLLLLEGLASEPELIARLSTIASSAELDVSDREHLVEFIFSRLKSSARIHGALPHNAPQLIRWLAQRGELLHAWDIANLITLLEHREDYQALVVLHGTALPSPEFDDKKRQLLRRATDALSPDPQRTQKLRQRLVLAWAHLGECARAAELVEPLDDVEVSQYAARACIVDAPEAARVIANVIADPLLRAQVAIRLLWRDSLDLSR
ncbi:MAG: hypothetical protein AAGI01_09495 [Myxococcota bacterium]